MKRKKTFTKVWVSRLLVMGCIWITLSYVLAYLGKDQIAEQLSETVANVIISTILGYLCKSYFETKEEAKMKYLRERMHETEETIYEDKLETETYE